MTSAATDRETGTDEPSSRGALSRLIQDANDRGLSFQKMSDQTAGPDGKARLSKPYLQKLVDNPPLKAPSAKQLEAIAAGLLTSENRVKRAAAEQWLEYEATELAGYADEVRIIVGHLAGMSETDLKRWRAMIEADERARRDQA
ncbi:hypothetical protein [Streptomyces californicus]|uniref:hypothetical protein n=1 Tax=Streptomyces californicus TaxID=67351 RepID=UPI00332D9BD8